MLFFSENFSRSFKAKLFPWSRNGWWKNLPRLKQRQQQLGQSQQVGCWVEDDFPNRQDCSDDDFTREPEWTRGSFSGRIEENYRRERVFCLVWVWKEWGENEQGKYRKKSRKKVSSVCVEKKSGGKSENLIKKEERKEWNNEGLRSERKDKG